MLKGCDVRDVFWKDGAEIDFECGMDVKGVLVCGFSLNNVPFQGVFCGDGVLVPRGYSRV